MYIIHSGHPEGVHPPRPTRDPQTLTNTVFPQHDMKVTSSLIRVTRTYIYTSTEVEEVVANPYVQLEYTGHAYKLEPMKLLSLIV